MTDDPIQTLERELVAAARRAAEAPAEPVGVTAPDDRSRWRLRRPLALVAIFVPVLAVLAAVLLTHSSSDRSPSGHASAEPTPSAVLAVLRRRGAVPTGQGLSVMERTARVVSNPAVTLQRASSRQLSVTVAPGDSVALDIAVVRAAGGRQLIGLTVPSHPVGGAGEGSTAMMYLIPKRTSQAYATVGQLRAGGVATWLGQDRDDTEDYAVLVPDGVARVRLVVPGDPTANVHDNVAGFRLSKISPNYLSKQLSMIWYGASGKVIHRVTGTHIPSPAQQRAHLDAQLRTMRAHLAVLRRPGPAVSERAQQTARLDSGLSGTTVIGSSIRVARTNTAVGTIVLALARQTMQGTAGVVVSDDQGSGCCATPKELLSTGDLSSSQSGHSGITHTVVLLPDGIEAIAVDINGVTVRAKVVNNVAVLSTRGATKLGASPAMTWYGASGQVIRQIPAHG